jgi:glycosyltransferase involved in cell wall biosynthesis
MQEAFSHGACVVATTVGGRIQGTSDGINCLIRDHPMEFAQAILELLASPERRVSLGEAALSTAREFYSTTAIYDYLDGFISRQTGFDMQNQAAIP